MNIYIYICVCVCVCVCEITDYCFPVMVSDVNFVYSINANDGDDDNDSDDDKMMTDIVQMSSSVLKILV